MRALVVHCAADGPPAPATYEITAAGDECAGSCARQVSSLEQGTTVLGRAEASSGRLTITESAGSQVVGTVALSGALVVG